MPLFGPMIKSLLDYMDRERLKSDSEFRDMTYNLLFKLNAGHISPGWLKRSAALAIRMHRAEKKAAVGKEPRP